MIRLGKSPTNLEAISLMTEILLTHILILSNQEKFMSFKVQNKIWDPQNLIDTAHEKKKQGNDILYEMFGELLSLYIPRRVFVFIRAFYFITQSLIFCFYMTRVIVTVCKSVKVLWV